MKRLIRIVILIAVLLFSTGSTGQAQGKEYWKTERYSNVIEASKKMGYSKSEIDSLFSSPRMKFYPNIHAKFREAQREMEDTSYNIYKRFLKAESIKRGEKFMKEHISLLRKVERNTGVKKEIIVALFRVESNFGSFQAPYQAFGALNSIVRFGESGAFWTEWGKRHLVSFLDFCKKEKKHVGEDIFSIGSSYAGALGIPQFLPGNYKNYALDGDGNGKIDLFNSIPDAAWSSANLLRANGWVYNKREALERWNDRENFIDCILEYAERL